MRRFLLAVMLASLVAPSSSPARGLLIPVDKNLPPLALLDHKVTINLEDQLAVTRIEQTFRNHTDRDLEATYIFPVPKGASVNRFTMWVNDKETKGELVEADKARKIYTDIVRQTHDPALLEYLGADLLRLRVFPVPKRGDQKVALKFNSVCAKEGKVVEYIYPLKTDGKAVGTLEKFAINATVKSQHGITNVYSPSHTLSLKRTSEKEIKVTFEKDQALLDRDFQLYYSTGKDDIGMTVLTHRPVADEKGFFTLLVSPRFGLSEKDRLPRDLVMVLDTSGSMRGEKMDQARKALKYCLKNLSSKDRFALISFATTVNRFEDKLVDASSDQLAKARAWVDDLDATGGTAINDALASALELRPKDQGRTFTVVFFTDGQPTIGETDPEKIFKNVKAKNSAHTRIFTFGVGDDVNTALLDRLADQTRALSAYVRPAEDIELKVSSLYTKIANPVLTDLKLTATSGIRLSEIYPAKLPDLFHGGQLIVMGRFSGKGASAIRLTGKVGKEIKEFAYDLTFPEKTPDGKEFVEQLWARRKVGYLLDEIRVNGENKELVSEVTALAKKYGITTPYTSYLIIPDAPTTVVTSGPSGKPTGGGGFMGGVPGVLKRSGKGGSPKPVVEFAREPGDLSARRGDEAGKDLDKKHDGKAPESRAYQKAKNKKEVYERARELLSKRDKDGVNTGKLGVDYTLEMNDLRRNTRLERTAVRNVYGRNCMEIGGVWIDDAFKAKTKAVVVKAQSDAYFRILTLHPKVKAVFQLGNHLVWITPSGTALVVDASSGKEKLADKDIESLFVSVKK
jgi:Ca-activated chloride channel family protein